MIRWRFARFEDLAPREVHDLYQARAAAFVVEQDCAFQDLDGADPRCWHLLGYGASRAAPPSAGSGGELVAYCRLVPPGLKFAEPSIGRVVTTQAVRGTGRGRELMREAIARAEELWPGRAIRIGAQHRLERFYRELGFEAASAPYDEDGILHIEMVRPAAHVPDRSGEPVGR